jgi:hypothetical protein
MPAGTSVGSSRPGGTVPSRSSEPGLPNPVISVRITGSTWRFSPVLACGPAGMGREATAVSGPGGPRSVPCQGSGPPPTWWWSRPELLEARDGFEAGNRAQPPAIHPTRGSGGTARPLRTNEIHRLPATDHRPPAARRLPIKLAGRNRSRRLRVVGCRGYKEGTTEGEGGRPPRSPGVPGHHPADRSDRLVTSKTAARDTSRLRAPHS